MGYSFNNYNSFKVVVSASFKQYDKLVGWKDILLKQAPNFKDWEYAMLRFDEETASVIAAIGDNLTRLSMDSLSIFASLAEEYQKDIERMLSKSQSADDFRNTLYYAVAAHDRLLIVLDKMYQKQLEYGMISELDSFD